MKAQNALHQFRAEEARLLEAQRKASDSSQSAFAKLRRLEVVREKVRSKEWKLVQQGLAELGDERKALVDPEVARTDFDPVVTEKALRTMVDVTPGFLASDFFSGDPFSALPDVFLPNTP